MPIHSAKVCSSRKTPPCGLPRPSLHLADDAAGDVVARQQLRRAVGVLVAQHVAEAFFLVLRRLRFVVVRDVAEHEPVALAVPQHAALAANAFGDEDAADARRPDHAGRVELHELHVDEFGPGVVGERVAVAGVLPRVARDLVRLADAAGGQNDGLGLEDDEPAALAVVAERPGDAVAVLEEPDDRALHVDRDALVDAVVLQRADQFQAGAVADVGQSRIAVAAEVALQDPAVLACGRRPRPRLRVRGRGPGLPGRGAGPSASC